MIIREYVEGESLREDEFLLKLREDQEYFPEKREWGPAKYKTGFLTKLTKKGELPVAFHKWGGLKYSETGYDHPIYVFKEDFRSGWSIIKWRFGQSQNWATVKHPEGFTVEIYLQQLLELIKETTVDAGLLIGEYKWSDHKLIKK